LWLSEIIITALDSSMPSTIISITLIAIKYAMREYIALSQPKINPAAINIKTISLMAYTFMIAMDAFYHKKVNIYL